jgi:hypothetical protein
MSFMIANTQNAVAVLLEGSAANSVDAHRQMQSDGLWLADRHNACYEIPCPERALNWGTS